MRNENIYQFLENPTQVDRLPESRPELEFRHEAYSAEDELTNAVNTLSSWLLVPAISAFLILVASALVRCTGPYGFWFACVTGSACLLTVVHLLRGKQRHDTTVEVFLCLTIGLEATVQIPAPLLALIAAGFLGSLSYRFAQHWGAICTASPMGRREAMTLQREWHGYLNVVAVVPGAVVLVSVIFDSTMIPVATLLIIAVYHLFDHLFVRGRQLHVDLPVYAWVSWLSYNPVDEDLPGVLCSPAGTTRERWSHVFAPCVVLTMLISSGAVQVMVADVVRVFGVSLPAPLHLPLARSIGVPGNGSLAQVITLVGGILVMSLGTIAWPVVLTWPLLSEAYSLARQSSQDGSWDRIVETLNSSSDPTEKNSLFVGRNATDGAPLLVPRTIFREHAHFLGDSGSGKTALGLAPFIEQMFGSDECSIIVIDLKADTLELYAAMNAAAERRRLAGATIPLKHFTIESERSSYAFNPMQQPFWGELEQFVRVDLLCGALGLEYGADYGEGYYSSANAAVLHALVQQFSDVSSIAEAARCVQELARTSKSSSGPAKGAGDHVGHVLQELSVFQPLNVTKTSGHPADVVDQAIDLCEVFQKPSLTYFHLSATLAPKAAPTIARLLTYSLLAGATRTKRTIPVYLVIDEFQRMVARNVEFVLQLARSMGVGVILANQSLEDLRTSRTDLRTPIEANCRYRQWFSVSSSADRQRLTRGSGECVAIDEMLGPDVTPGVQRSSYVGSGQSFPRLSLNDILLLSDHPNQSAVQISRGQGYAQFGGMAVVVETPFHISSTEYERRRRMTWPAPGDGAFVPRLHSESPTAPPDQSPPRTVLTTEVIGSSSSHPGQPVRKSRRQRPKKEAGK